MSVTLAYRCDICGMCYKYDPDFRPGCCGSIPYHVMHGKNSWLGLQRSNLEPVKAEKLEDPHKKSYIDGED